MKLYNTVIVYDVYTLAEDAASARDAALQFIRDGEQPLPPSEQTALEARNPRDVREAWHGEKPLVAADVSDADFTRVKGKTTMEAFEMLYKKAKPDEKPATNGKTVAK